MVESKGYMPLRDQEGRLSVDGPVNILVKNSFKSYSFAELLDGDSFTGEEIAARLQRNVKILSEMKEGASQYFFEVFIFENGPEEEKLDAMISNQFQNVGGKKYLKCISVDMSKESVSKHFQIPASDAGLSKTIKSVFAEGVHGGDGYADGPSLDELVARKEEEYKVEFKVKTPVITYVLIAANILVAGLIFLYSKGSGISYGQLLIDFGAKVNSNILAGQYWRFVTPIFLHANLMHLLINCYSLYAIGVSVEKIFGRSKFLAVYMAAGILGNIASFMFSLNPGVGASGSIFGLLGTLLYLGLEKPALFKAYFGYNVLVTIVINLGYGFSRSGIDNYAHIGGLMGGFLMTGAVSKANRRQWYLNRYLYAFLLAAIIFSGITYGFGNRQNQIALKANELERLDREQAWSKAEQKAEEILALDPGDAEIKASALWTLAKAEALTQKYDEAAGHAKMLVELNPPSGHYLLGLIYFDTQQFALSREELLAAKQAGADSEQIDKLLDQLGEAQGQ